MDDINKELVSFLERCCPKEDLNEIIFQIQTGGTQSIRLVNLSVTSNNDADFIFNNQQYKVVVTRKLPLFRSETEYTEEEEENDYFDGDNQLNDTGDID